MYARHPKFMGFIPNRNKRYVLTTLKLLGRDICWSELRAVLVTVLGSRVSWRRDVDVKMFRSDG